VHGLDGLRALVTGRNSDLRAAVVRRLTDEGASVVPVDASDEEGIRRAVADASGLLTGLDALICCAGEAPEAPLSDTSIEDWDRLLEDGLTGPYLFSLACLPLLQGSDRGSIVHISSDVGVWGNARLGAFSTISAALITLSQMLAVEAGPQGITVNAVCPGAGGRRATGGGDDPESRLVPPVGRVASPDEIAGVVAFLLGPDARSVSGAALLVDGGMRAGYRAWKVAP
jgi:NAD(P)-dependent dehydrogenase (short-subunit alcohol dehydrogenase family)